jgi:hypothetical protein
LHFTSLAFGWSIARAPSFPVDHDVAVSYVRVGEDCIYASHHRYGADPLVHLLLDGFRLQLGPRAGEKSRL